jgi:hypothetical protein
MKKILRIAAVTFIIAATGSGSGFAGETCHYVNGVEGLKAATVPPPGLYFRTYTVRYSADTLTDPSGESLDIGFDVNVYAFVSRFVWVTQKKILGANYFGSVIVPLVYNDLEIGAAGVDDDHFGFGDITIEPFAMTWHGNRHDAAFGISFFLPTGHYNVNDPASPGKDFWTTMLTAGVTGYFDEQKNWSASILSRYEIHSEKDDVDVTPGDDFHFEWGVGRKVGKTWDVGLSGYCQWQVTDDKGSDVTWDKGVHDKALAIGPEVGVFIPISKVLLSVRSQWEFGNKDRSEGNITTVTLTKIF